MPGSPTVAKEERIIVTIKTTPANLIGWVGCTACIVLMAYYMVIIGWMFAYAVKSISSTFNGIDPEGTKAIFQEFMNSPVEMAGYTLFVIAVLGLTVTQGLKNGVERACKWMLPILGIMLVVLAARSRARSGFAGVEQPSD